MSRSPHTIQYRLDIQGLRAVAIALVVLAHANVPGFAGGYIGVDVFFVLSGYLITGLLVKERLATGSIRYGQFLARRLRRLLPAMLAMLVVVLMLAAAILSAYEMRMQTGSFVFSATWTSNFFFAFYDFDYFSALQAKDLFLHTWSLGVEEQFYIVWPWLVILSFALLGYVDNKGRKKELVFGLLAAVFTASLLLCLHWTQMNPLLSFYMMPARGWQFALGAAVFVGFHHFGKTPDNSEQHASLALLSSTLGTIGIVLILVSAVLLDDSITYPSYYALFPSIGAALVIAAGVNTHSSIINRCLASSYCVWVGDRSYSLYLWHWPVLILGAAFGVNADAMGIILLVAVSMLLASVSYSLIERPFWKGKFSGAAPSRTVLASTAAVIVAIGSAHALKSNVYGEPQVTAELGNYNPRRDMPAIYAPDLSCDTWFRSAELLPCISGGENAKYTAVMLGDSIGAQWVSLLPNIFRAPDWRVSVLTKSGCAIADEEYYYDAVGGIYDICTTWRQAALDYIAETQPDVVFIGSSSHYEFSADQWIGGIERVLASTSDAAKKIVLIPGTPVLSFNGPSCVESPRRFSFRLDDSRRECEEAQLSDDSERVAAYLVQAAAQFANVHVLNLNDLVCPARRCAAQTLEGLTVFRDHRHLTESFVVAQIPEVLTRLERIEVAPEFLEEIAEIASLE